MEKKLLCLLLIISVNSFSQNIYKTESGITFKVGDELHLGEPKNDESPSYITFEDQWTSLFTVQGNNSENLDFIDKKVIITEIDLSYKQVRFYFEAFSREYYILIEEAIKNKEVIFTEFDDNDKLTENNVLDKYDKIKKLKGLLDIDAITDIEYLQEKERLLLDEDN